MKYDPDTHHRRSIRLKEYDYSQPGAYFLTICTHERRHQFGEIVNARMQLNDMGRQAAFCWEEIPGHFPNVELDAFVIMPNHIHGIILITSAGAKDISPSPSAGAKDISPSPSAGAKNVSPLRPHGTSKTVGSIVRGFKIGVTKWARQHAHGNEVWQRNYYEHIIRDDVDLERIRQYVRDNPALWESDCLNARAGETG